jgi:hypothetical protein
MTKVQIRFRLEQPLNGDMMPRIAAAHSVFGVLRIQLASEAREILVDYDASRLRTQDVGAVLKRAGIPVELEK